MLLVLVGSSSQGGVSYQLLQLHIAAPWESRGVAWIVPVITFTVLTGLNTDYDVFLVSGIRKMRVAGEQTLIVSPQSYSHIEPPHPE
eukprot:scaffold124484_cov29-Tisochrysis_lutea.AAC.5